MGFPVDYTAAKSWQESSLARDSSCWAERLLNWEALVRQGNLFVYSGERRENTEEYTGFDIEMGKKGRGNG